MLRRSETRRGLNSGLTPLERRDQTGKNAAPLSPQPQGAGSIPVPLAPRILNSWGLQRHGVQPILHALTPLTAAASCATQADP